MEEGKTYEGKYEGKYEDEMMIFDVKGISNCDEFEIDDENENMLTKDDVKYVMEDVPPHQRSCVLTYVDGRWELKEIRTKRLNEKKDENAMIEENDENEMVVTMYDNTNDQTQGDMDESEHNDYDIKLSNYQGDEYDDDVSNESMSEDSLD